MIHVPLKIADGGLAGTENFEPSMPSEAKRHRPLSYVPALDGIRAVAIIAVITFHAWPGLLPGGYAGVDVFFVLSGFLITSIILNDIRRGAFSFAQFYSRRVSRLLPNALALLGFVLLVWAVFLPSGMVLPPAEQGMWALFNLSNIYVWRNLGDYWGSSAEWSALTHFWSLGIEEQFYLFFPGVLVLLLRYSPKRAAACVALLCLGSLSVFLLFSKQYPTAAFYLLPTRVWELLFGAGLTFLTPATATGIVPTRSPLRNGFVALAAWAGLVLVLIGLTQIGGENGMSRMNAVLPALGTMLIICGINQRERRLSGLLSRPGMAFVGKISYSLYLWHWPCIILGRSYALLWGFPSAVGSTIGAFVGVLLALAAYFGIEQPMRIRATNGGRRLAGIATAYLFVLGACVYIMWRPPVADPDQRFNTPSFSVNLYDVGLAAAAARPKAICYSDVRYPEMAPRETEIWRNGGIIKRHGPGNPRVVLIGSSHALMYSKLLDEVCEKQGIPVAFFGISEGTPAFFESTPTVILQTQEKARLFDKQRRHWIQQWHPELLLVADRWDYRSTTGTGDFEQRLRDFLEVVSPLAGQVAFVTQVPVLSLGEQFNPRAVVTWNYGNDRQLMRLMPDDKDTLRRQLAVMLERVCAEFPNATVLRADERFYNQDGSIRYAAGRDFFYIDDDHLSDAGAAEVRGHFSELVASTTSPIGSSQR